MRYLSIFTHEGQPTPPSPELMASMGALIEEGMKAGWLVATEGIAFGEKGVRVSRSKKGNVTVTDGPFTEAKEILGGYALMEARDKDHIVALCRRFLEVAGDGTCEVHQLFVPPKT
jgi:hypothetical protein